MASPEKQPKVSDDDSDDSDELPDCEPVDCEQILRRASNEFATDIYQALLPVVPSDNLVFSPFGIHTVLGMISQGARGTTKTEIVNGIKFKEDEDIVTDIVELSYDEIIQGFQLDDVEEGTEGTGRAIEDCNYFSWVLQTTNRFYLKTGFKFCKQFVDWWDCHYLTNFEQFDLSSKEKCVEAAESINKWVATQTKTQVKEVISEDSLSPEKTSLVLVGCIYFRGMWLVQFPPANTHQADFSVSSTKTVRVSMMRHAMAVPCGELTDLDAMVIDIPYQDGRLSMRVFLPNEVDGLAKIQNGLGTLRQDGKDLVKEAMATFREAKYPYKVQVDMPKFKIETCIVNVQQVLANSLGMTSMISETDADLGEIATPDEASDNTSALFVSHFIHKAYISVREEGTETAPAVQTGALRRGSRTKWTNIPFNMNHPFYFEIVDHENDDLVLFSGHCKDPSQE